MSMRLRKLTMIVVLGSCMAPGAVAFADEDKPSRSVGEYAADVLLTVQIKAAIIAEKDLSVLDISVETMNGIATLSGTVGSSAQAELAERVAADVEGVKKVENTLKIAPVRAIE